MDFVTVLRDYDAKEVGGAVLEAVEALFNTDRRLFEVDVSKRAVAARLASHLAKHFAGLSVDVEYNRMGEAPKRVAWSEGKDDVFPDIIVHQRGAKNNLLAIEVKKDSNWETKEKDIKKLREYRRDENLEYKHALFMRFGVKDGTGTVSECEWVNP